VKGVTRHLTVEELERLRGGSPPSVAAPEHDLAEIIEALVARGDVALAQLAEVSHGVMETGKAVRELRSKVMDAGTPEAVRPYVGSCPCCAQAQLEFLGPRKVECQNCGAVFDASLVLEPGFPRSRGCGRKVARQ
jgi:hypothetical protein